MTDTAREKTGLVLVIIVCVGSLTWIALRALSSSTLDPNASTLLGAIVAGLVATAAACIQALRGYSMSAQLAKVTDQLAASAPASDTATPQPVIVTNTDENAVPTKDS